MRQRGRPRENLECEMVNVNVTEICAVSSVTIGARLREALESGKTHIR